MLDDKHFPLYTQETGETRMWLGMAFESYVWLAFWLLLKRDFGPSVSRLFFSFVKCKVLIAPHCFGFCG